MHCDMCDSVCDPYTGYTLCIYGSHICSGKPKSNPVLKNHTHDVTQQHCHLLCYILSLFFSSSQNWHKRCRWAQYLRKKYLYLNCGTCLPTSLRNCPRKLSVDLIYLQNNDMSHVYVYVTVYLTKIYSVHNTNAFSEY